MNQSICIVCGKSTAFRKGKLYCSNSCKTKAHQSKVSGVVIGLDKPGNEKYSQERKSFFMDDYELWAEKKHWDFDLFCFVVKSFPENEDIDLVHQFASSITNGENFTTNWNSERHPIGREFIKFQERFYSGQYSIKKSRENPAS